jgi:hypothetical protein
MRSLIFWTIVLADMLISSLYNLSFPSGIGFVIALLTLFFAFLDWLDCMKENPGAKN